MAIVNSPAGQVEGLEIDQIHVFKGIPYAKPPVGPLRWRPPEPHPRWEGVFQATAYGSIAMQRWLEIFAFVYGLLKAQGIGLVRRILMVARLRFFPEGRQSEDCLTLNVRSPELDPQAKLPVMVWIHGGAHQDGASLESFYDSIALPKRGVVTVTINYRLGLMGFFTHPELNDESPHGVSGNYGTLDQIMALRWVQENIAAFGGDPENVTIFGESAGGESVMHLLSSPLAQGLFHKAIPQSPATGEQLSMLDRPNYIHRPALEKGVEFAKLAGVTGPNQIEQLRAMPAAKLLALLRRQRGWLGNFYPVIDGHVLPKSTFETFMEGEQAQVPLLIGSNRDEFSIFSSVVKSPLLEYAEHPQTPGELPSYMREEFGADLDPLLEIYPQLPTLERGPVSDFQGDNFFGAPARFYAGQMATLGQPTYFYQFRRISPLPTQTGGAFHAAELSFVHGSDTPLMKMDDQDWALSEKMMGYWINFAKTGDPNGGDLPIWPNFDDADPVWMLLDRGENGVAAEPVDRETQYQIFIKRLLRLASTGEAIGGVR